MTMTQAQIDELNSHVLPGWFRISEYNTGPGWHDLIWQLHCNLVKEKPDYKIAQIKQKFGGLRYYIDGQNDRMTQLIREAEDKSYHLCEFHLDGTAPGQLRVSKSGWLDVICDECAAMYPNKEYELVSTHDLGVDL